MRLSLILRTMKPRVPLSAEAKAEADNTDQDLENFHYYSKRNAIVVILYSVIIRS